MNSLSHPFRAPNRTLSSLCVLAGAALLMGGHAAAVAQSASGWTERYDARLHVGIRLPAGWTMKTEGYTLVAQSADHTSLVLAEAFAARPGESAQTVVSTLGTRHPALFARAQITKNAPQPNAGDTLLAALTYKNASGNSAQARALCSVYQHSGMLYAIAAPDAHFAHERPLLIKALQSLRFGPPPNAMSASGAGGSGTRIAKATGAPAGSASHNAEEKAAGLKFVKWTDPKEHSFSVDVPAGWKVEGGATRVASTHVNQTIQMESPDRDISIMIGDPNMPMFLIPNPQQMRMYNVSEGVPYSANGTFREMFLHYMPAPEFNKWYLNGTLKPAVDELTITKEEELASQEHQQADAFNKDFFKMTGQQGHVTVSIATSEFKGISKQTGKPIVGVIASNMMLTQFANTPGHGNWGPTQLLLTGCNDGEGLSKRQTILRMTLERMLRTWVVDPQWQQQLQQQVSAGTQQVMANTNAAIKANGERSKQIARRTEAARESIMGSYWKRVGAKSEQQRNFVNHIGDTTDVRDPQTGHTAKVSSGYNNYYHDPQTGTILGTNSTTRPPIDFTPLEQF